MTEIADLERPVVYNRAGRAVGEVARLEYRRRRKSEYTI